ncbi:MAG: DUF4158 domain-containing protein [Candidatus Competibacteraceae bacterium]
MPTIQETAYPRLKAHVSAHDLAAIYTPTPDELALAGQSARGEGARLGFLILLKTFQRLGYFVPVGQVPTSIAEYIAASAQTQAGLSDLAGYDLSGTRRRHLHIIRQTLQVQGYGKEARHAMTSAMGEAARTKEDLADLINVAIEELVRKKYELPAFDTLARAARHVRSVLYRRFYQQVDAALGSEEKARIETLFVPDPQSRFTPWHTLKQEPGSPTLTHFKVWLDRRADGLVQTLRDLVTAYRAEGTAQDKIAAMAALLPNRGEAILQGCEDHMAHAGDNYLPFLWRF